MYREEAPYIVPGALVVPVVDRGERGAGLSAAVGERDRQGVAFFTDGGERSALERLDEAVGVADRDDVLHPPPRVAAGDEFDDSGGVDPRILPPELRLRRFVGDERA